MLTVKTLTYRDIKTKKSGLRIRLTAVKVGSFVVSKKWIWRFINCDELVKMV